MQNRNPRVEDIVLAHRSVEFTYWVIDTAHPSRPTPLSNVDARLGLLIEQYDEDCEFDGVVFRPGHLIEQCLNADAMAVSERPVNEWDADEGVAAVEKILAATGRKAHAQVAA